MGKSRGHFDEKLKYKIGKQIGRAGICGMIWIETTEDKDKVTCKNCLKKLANLKEKI